MEFKSIEDLRESHIKLRSRYDNFIGGEWVAPVKGQYFQNITPITGKTVCEVARSTAEDVEKALDAAHKAATKWNRSAAAERALILNRIADRMEQNLDLLALAETLDNGKPIRETRAADIPLAIDHFRYFAGCIRAQEGSLSELDHDTIAYHFHEPLGVVGQIIPVELPAADGGVEAGAGRRRGQLRGAQARRADAHERHGSDGADRRSAACWRASMWSMASAWRRASRWRRASGSPRSPLRARRPPGVSSCSMRRKTSFR